MYISSTEFRANMNKYLERSATEDIYITKHGKMVARVSGTTEERKRMAESLVGCISSDIDADKMYEWRQKDYEDLV
jgi:prevent-host-death family protein